MDAKFRENLARYIIRAPFSQGRLKYVPDDSKAMYWSKTGNDNKEFEALDFIASITSHISNKNEKTVRYVGF